MDNILLDLHNSSHNWKSMRCCAMDVFPVKNRESIITTPTIRAPDQSAVFAGYTQLSNILACVAGVLVWKEIGEIKACENVLGARGESLPSFSFPFALFITLAR